MHWKASVSLISLVLIPVVGIATVWAVVAKPLSRELPSVSDDFFQEATYLGPGGHELIPKLDRARIVTPDRPHDPMEAETPARMAKIGRRRVFEVSTNTRGMRGPELSPKSGYRVLCLGESVTFGWGVPVEESYPARLAELLDVEVINAGIPAMRPSQMSLWLQRHGSEIDADLILFTARPNWTVRNPWRDYFDSIGSARRTVHPTPVALILPPISTFDLRGRQQRPSEVAKLQERMGDVPWLDLTPSFWAAMPESDLAQQGNGVLLQVSGNLQKVVVAGSDEVLFEATSSDPRTLAPGVVDWLESNRSYAEPLMFDGAHPDSAGFEVFAGEVAAFVKTNGWR